MKKKVKNLCLIGFGNAGQEFCRLLILKHDEVLESTGYDIRVTGISTRSKGALLNHDGIDLQRALMEVSEFRKFNSENPDLVNMDSIEIIDKSNANIMVELSTLSIKDGQPAITHIETAFNNEMDVITANKGPIAWDYKRLNNISQDKGLNFLYETTVMDGTPIYNLVRETLPGCKVLGIMGILNSTTNFILEEMESGNTYEEAVKEAQKRGFAEANPSMDVDGWDAAAKTTALINVLMGGELTPMDIDRTGIADISMGSVKDALDRGKKIKLLCEGYIDDGEIKGRVKPVEFEKNDIFASIDATSSYVVIKTDLMGDIGIVEKNPEIQQTAYGIYSDLLTLIKRYNVISA